MSLFVSGKNCRKIAQIVRHNAWRVRNMAVTVQNHLTKSESVNNIVGTVVKRQANLIS